MFIIINLFERHYCFILFKESGLGSQCHFGSHKLLDEKKKRRKRKASIITACPEVCDLVVHNGSDLLLYTHTHIYLHVLGIWSLLV